MEYSGKGEVGRNTEQMTRFFTYLENKELSQNTIDAYMSSMKGFFSVFDEISKENGLRWKNNLLNDGIKPKSVNVKLNAFNSFCTMLGKENEKVKTVRLHNATAVNNVISAADYQKLLAGLSEDGNLKWYFAVKLLAATGARVSEAVRLRKQDLDKGYAEMWTKGKMRRIYIPDSFKNESKEFYAELEPTDFLIISKYGTQITTRGIAQMLQNFAKRYDIDKAVMHPHSFRHLFALEFLKRNGNLSLLADIMGHSSVSTTAIYTRMTKEQQQQEINKTIDW